MAGWRLIQARARSVTALGSVPSADSMMVDAHSGCSIRPDAGENGLAGRERRTRRPVTLLLFRTVLRLDTGGVFFSGPEAFWSLVTCGSGRRCTAAWNGRLKHAYKQYCKEKLLMSRNCFTIPPGLLRESDYCAFCCCWEGTVPMFPISECPRTRVLPMFPRFYVPH